MIEKILKNSSLGLIFLVPFIPLYVANSLFFPFISGKGFAFRIIVEILAALYILLVLRNKHYAPRFSWISLGVTLFVITIFIADMLGVNPLRSLWSNFERMEGWVVLAHLWAYFVVVTGVFGSHKEGRRMWHRFFSTTIVAALIVGIYAVVQLAGGAEIHQGSRIDASLGNAAYMAVYMLFHVFISAYLSFVEKGKKKIGLSVMYMVLATFFAFLLFETATRGTMLGLVGGILLALGIFAVFGKGQEKKPRIMAGGFLVAIILVGVLFYANKNAAFIQNHEALQRLASISLQDTKTQARGYIWPMAVKGAFDNPKTAVIGWGQENFNYIFNANYNPKMWSQEQWFDRAHSVFLDWLVAGGLVGFLLYLSLFVLSIVFLWKSEMTFAEKCIFTGLIVAYAIHNIFVFDNLISYILFFTLLSFVHTMSAGAPLRWLERSDVQSDETVVVRDYIFFPLTVLIFLSALYFINIRPLQANTRLIDALIACQSTPSPVAYSKALELNQYMANQEIREQLVSCAGNVWRSTQSEATKTQFYDLVKKELAAQIEATPNDARIYVLGGMFFNGVGDWVSGKPLLEKAHELSPSKQTITFELATNYMNTGKVQEAVDLLQKSYLDAPENINAATALAIVLILNGQEAKAKEILKDIPEVLNDPRVLAVYAKLNQFDKVVAGYKILVAKEPKNMQYHGALVAAYYQSGQYSLALAKLEEMRTLFPEAKAQIEATIKEVQVKLK